MFPEEEYGITLNSDKGSNVISPSSQVSPPAVSGHSGSYCRQSAGGRRDERNAPRPGGNGEFSMFQVDEVRDVLSLGSLNRGRVEW